MFLTVSVPLAVATTVVALGQRDGLLLDVLVLAAVRERLSPRHRVAAPNGVRPAPARLTAHQPAGGKRVSPVPLELPADGVDDTGAQTGRSASESTPAHSPRSNTAGCGEASVGNPDGSRIKPRPRGHIIDPIKG
ncbi:hypothetical protein [Amycolatopsis sp. FDAARGOS 1241]|uniref:hypothetical protein n=1 Tax=Amycolatopsis sp. FDAARGOS 1241 TaxID=2778070 RepID=UPI00194ED9A4|nr:hypothetical protein [Amycolatopsis sp. FDAARGOS 1241]QRP42723.1 hypothetical protein I6J71_24870 [Amycolatopsis sp. FDAARGOS 1241]